MERREFVRSAGAGLAVVALGGGCVGDGELVEIGAPTLTPVLGESAVRELGRRYMAQTPNERTHPALLQALRDALDRARRHWWQPTPSFAALITRDFESGQTVFVDGWMLSVNEARQCAIFALTAI